MAALRTLRGRGLPGARARQCRARRFRRAARDGIADYIGAFAVTAGARRRYVADRFKRATTTTHRSWSRRWLTVWQSFAERLHQLVRQSSGVTRPTKRSATLTWCGKDTARHPSGAGLSRRSPIITPKGTYFDLAEGDGNDVKLTEALQCGRRFGMRACFSRPTAAVSAFGKIERDQVEDYAKRKGWTSGKGRRWLAQYPQLRRAWPARTAAE